jgi:predicted PurR-regulated permease PerM
MHRLLVTVAVVAIVAFLWQTLSVLILAFAGLVLAVALRALAEPIAARTPLSERWSVILVVLLLIALAVVGSWLFGGALAEQGTGLVKQIPAGIAQLRALVARFPLAQSLLEGGAVIDQAVTFVASRAGAIAKGVFGFTADALLVFFIALYIAVEPGLYRRGFLRLLPPDARREAGPAMLRAGDDLRRWLVGQLVAMVGVGVCTGVGLWLAGVPMALALGMIAGVFEFIPLVGPIIGAVPGLLVALASGGDTVLWALLVYVIVQQIEGNLLMPIVQRWAVSLAPVVGLLATVAFTIVFGLPGLLVATPLAVVIASLVNTLYVPRVADLSPDAKSEDAPKIARETGADTDAALDDDVEGRAVSGGR